MLLKNYDNYMNIISNRFFLKKIGSSPELINKTPYIVPTYIKNIIDNNVDWRLEESLGFSQRA
jgi:small nuclear ribonucleoprotein (snRNP)-like protein